MAIFWLPHSIARLKHSISDLCRCFNVWIFQIRVISSFIVWEYFFPREGELLSLFVRARIYPPLWSSSQKRPPDFQSSRRLASSSRLYLQASSNPAGWTWPCHRLCSLVLAIVTITIELIQYQDLRQHLFFLPRTQLPLHNFLSTLGLIWCSASTIRQLFNHVRVRLAEPSRHWNHPYILTIMRCCRPWIETFIWIKGALPDFSGGWKFKIPRISFNYIMLHCMKWPIIQANLVAYTALTDTYILALTIIGSVIFYGSGNLDYIDALFFASGCATQSGLNTYVEQIS